MGDPVTIEKEMGITREEFLRVMARALDGCPHRFEGEEVRVEDGDRRLRISFHPQPDRRIGLFSIPVAQVHLAFEGYDEADVAETVDWFDQRFQRGGG